MQRLLGEELKKTLLSLWRKTHQNTSAVPKVGGFVDRAGKCFTLLLCREVGQMDDSVICKFLKNILLDERASNATCSFILSFFKLGHV